MKTITLTPEEAHAVHVALGADISTMKARIKNYGYLENRTPYKEAFTLEEWQGFLAAAVSAQKKLDVA